MRVNEQVQVRPKDAVAPYVGTAIGVGDGTLAVRSADGTVRAHPAAQCDSFGGDVEDPPAAPVLEPVAPVEDANAPVDEPPPGAPVKKARKSRKAAK